MKLRHHVDFPWDGELPVLARPCDLLLEVRYGFVVSYSNTHLNTLQNIHPRILSLQLTFFYILFSHRKPSLRNRVLVYFLILRSLEGHTLHSLLLFLFRPIDILRPTSISHNDYPSPLLLSPHMEDQISIVVQPQNPSGNDGMAWCKFHGTAYQADNELKLWKNIRK